MQNYKLYQLNIEKLLKNRRQNLAFRDNLNPDPADYRLVYEGSIDSGIGKSDNDILNDIFDLHNEDDRPNRDRLRSCSVSDVIVLDSKNDGRAYTVLVLGFRPVDFN